MRSSQIAGLVAISALAAALAASCGGGGDDSQPHAAGSTTTGTGAGGAGGGSTGTGGAAGGGTGGGGIGGRGGAGGTAGTGGTGGFGGFGGFGAGGMGGGGPVWPLPYDVHAADRDGCWFGEGQLTTDTIGPDVPHGDAMPFKHVLVLMLENRSFDHWFSGLPAYGVNDVDVATDAASNPDPTPPLTQIHRFHETRYCIADTTHEWNAVHLQYDNGAMDGFVATTNPGGARSMGYYTDVDLPYEYWLAKNFAIGDRYFSSLLGPTWPNRFYFWGATSWGGTNTGGVLPPLNKTKIVNEMETAGRSWQVYHDGTTSFSILFGPKYAGTGMGTFETDVANDTLPDLSIIDPSFMGAGQNDDHPPMNIQKGDEFMAYVVDTLWSNPVVWQNSVLFITFDEHGGYYDHVVPPPACVPDGDLPYDYAFDRYGIRVPVIVVSPFTKPGLVSHVVTDHTSITRFIENRFDLPAMTARDANAWPMLDYFDFANPPLVAPPFGHPDTTLDPAAKAWCESNPPGTGMP